MDAKETLALYEDILQGTHIAVYSIEEILKKAKRAEFREDLLRTRQDYRQIGQEAEENINRLGGTPKELSALTKINNWGVINAKALVNNSPENMSEIVIKGFEAGDECMQGYQEKYPNAEKTAKNLADKLQTIQETQRNIYQKYLN